MYIIYLLFFYFSLKNIINLEADSMQLKERFEQEQVKEGEE